MKKGFLLFVLLFSSFLRAFATPQAAGKIIQIPANPKAGFQWDYVLYIPQHIDMSKPLQLLFVMNNNRHYKTQEENEKSVLNRFQTRAGELVEWGIADGVGVPMVMPMVLRNKQDEPIYSHKLNRATFILKEGPYARLDLQVLSMLKDARKQLKKRGIRTQPKFLIAGFSAAASFGYKLAFLHPEKVLAVAGGGEHYPILPFEIYNGVNLIFPLGAYDMQTYTGKKFNKNAWLKVPIFMTEGMEDYNDPLPWNDAYDEESRVATLKVLGNETAVDRWEKAREILAEEAPNVQTYTYPSLEHEWVKQDVIDFLNTHKNGGPLKPITPTDTSDRPSKLPIHVSKLYWEDEAKKVLVPDLYQHMKERELYMRVEGHGNLPFWADSEYTCAFDVLYKGKTVLENLPCAASQFYPKEFSLQTVRFSDEDLAALKKTGGRTFSLRSHYPQIWDVPEHLTFTIK